MLKEVCSHQLLLSLLEEKNFNSLTRMIVIRETCPILAGQLRECRTVKHI